MTPKGKRVGSHVVETNERCLIEAVRQIPQPRHIGASRQARHRDVLRSREFARAIGPSEGQPLGHRGLQHRASTYDAVQLSFGGQAYPMTVGPPVLFAIRERLSGTILFVGTLVEAPEA